MDQLEPGPFIFSCISLRPRRCLGSFGRCPQNSSPLLTISPRVKTGIRCERGCLWPRLFSRHLPGRITSTMPILRTRWVRQGCSIAESIDSQLSESLQPRAIFHSFLPSTSSSSPVRAFLLPATRSWRRSRAGLGLARLASLSCLRMRSRCFSAFALWI